MTRSAVYAWLAKYRPGAPVGRPPVDGHPVHRSGVSWPASAALAA